MDRQDLLKLMLECLYSSWWWMTMDLGPWLKYGSMQFTVTIQTLMTFTIPTYLTTVTAISVTITTLTRFIGEWVSIPSGIWDCSTPVWLQINGPLADGTHKTPQSPGSGVTQDKWEIRFAIPRSPVLTLKLLTLSLSWSLRLAMSSSADKELSHSASINATTGDSWQESSSNSPSAYSWFTLYQLEEHWTPDPLPPLTSQSLPSSISPSCGSMMNSGESMSDRESRRTP